MVVAQPGSLTAPASAGARSRAAPRERPAPPLDPPELAAGPPHHPPKPPNLPGPRAEAAEHALKAARGIERQHAPARGVGDVERTAAIGGQLRGIHSADLPLE